MSGPRSLRIVTQVTNDDFTLRTVAMTLTPAERDAELAAPA